MLAEKKKKKENASWAQKSVFPFFLVVQLAYISQPPLQLSLTTSLGLLVSKIWAEVICVSLPGLIHKTSSMLFTAAPNWDGQAQGDLKWQSQN